MDSEHQSELEALSADLPLERRDFADEYLKDFNATEAVLRSRGYNPESRNTARSMGGELLGDPAIQAYLNLRSAQLSAEAGLSVIRILKRLEALAFADLDDIVHECGDGQIRLRPWDEIPAQSKAAIKRVKKYRIINRNGDEEWREEVEMKDDLAALKMLYVYLGMDDTLESAQRTLKRLKRIQNL